MLLQWDRDVPFLVQKASASVRCQLRKEMQELHSPAVSPARLATAFAVGTLLSFVPLPILDSLLVSLVMARFRQLNRASLLAARLVWNDLVVLSLAPTGKRLGVSLLPSTSVWSADPTPADKLIMLAFSVAAGYVLIAVAAAVVCYVIVWLVMMIIKKRMLAGKGLGMRVNVEGDQRLRRFLQKDLARRVFCGKV